MVKYNCNMNDYNLRLSLYSNPDFLTDLLKNKFKDKDVEVTVINGTDKGVKASDYLIINFVTTGYLFDKSEIEKVIELIKHSTCKVLILFPQYVPNNMAERSESFLKTAVSLNENTGIILTPELLGSSVKFNKNYISHEIIMQSIISERIKIKNDGRLINTISISTFCDRVIKEMFSFGISGKKLSLVGPRRVARTFAVKYLKTVESNTIMSSGEYDFYEIKGDVSVSVSFSLRLAIKNTKNSFIEFTNKEITSYAVPSKVSKNNSTKLDIIRNKSKKTISLFLKITIVLILVYLIPLILIFFSGALLLSSVKVAQSNVSLATKFVNGSYKISKAANTINLGNSFYFDTSNILLKSADLALEGLSMFTVANDFTSRILGKEIYDLTSYSSNVSASINKIYTNLGFLQTEITNFSNYIDNKINIPELRDKIYQAQSITSRISVLLGENKPMKYLILFQNNMELRPTGGFIGSYAITTFDKGRLTEIIVSDVYSADGQLKGHVEPPEPIKNYLGEGGWYMRDSNWDPDFSQSSTKVEWFLEKEVNEKVDGVIAIDLSFIKNILKVTGPIELTDFNKTITSENLYFETQSEVENDFFPGSIKKASFLTSLSKNLILVVENLPKDKYVPFFKEIYKSLEEKHIQLYIHDANTQKALTNLNFTGEIDMSTECNLRCLNDKYMLVDANLGVNKSNLFIKRSHLLNTTISKSGINHDLSVKYQNNAGQAVGQSGVYKTYSRLLLPIGAKVSEIRLHDIEGKYETLKYDEAIIGSRKEVGFLLEVVPGSQKTVQILWDIETNVFENGGEFNLLVQKQAGTDDDSLKVVIRTIGLTLTGKASPVYNTYLVRDFATKVYIK